MKSQNIVKGCILLGLLVIGLSGGCGKKSNAENRKIQMNRKKLEQMEKKDVVTIETQIHKNREVQTEHEKDDCDGEFRWSCLGDTIIMGDSRAAAFKEYEFLPSTQVLAEVGDHFTKIPDLKETLVLKNPVRVVVCYGINDLGYSAWGTPEKFAEKYYSLLKPLIKALPHTKFFICSMIPVRQDVVEREAVYKNIPEFNKAIEQMCLEKHIGFIDCDGLVNKDIYEPNEGIHFKADFYPVWGKYIYDTISKTDY